MNCLPAIKNPSHYPGLFLFDFGDRVNVGYTAAEIAFLGRLPEFAGGTAYQIYRVHENGGFELRGVKLPEVATREAICFLRHDGAVARHDFDDIIRAGKRSPLPCTAELRLLRNYSFEPSNVTALMYPAHASHLVSGWLSAESLSPGDRVEAGMGLLGRLESTGGMDIASITLPSSAPRDRSPEEILAAMGQPLQR